MTSHKNQVLRRYDRKPARKAVVLIVESDGVETRHDATTVDISTHGARVEAETELVPGQTLSLLRPDDPSYALRCLVVWSGDVSSDRDGQAGLEFLDPDSATLEN